MQHIVFANNWWLCVLSEAMARQGSINYLAGKRIFAPWTGKTHTRVLEWRRPISEYVDRKKVLGSLTGVLSCHPRDTLLK